MTQTTRSLLSRLGQLSLLSSLLLPALSPSDSPSVRPELRQGLHTINDKVPRLANLLLAVQRGRDGRSGPSVRDLDHIFGCSARLETRFFGVDEAGCCLNQEREECQRIAKGEGKAKRNEHGLLQQFPDVVHRDQSGGRRGDDDDGVQCLLARLERLSTGGGSRSRGGLLRSGSGGAAFVLLVAGELDAGTYERADRVEVLLWWLMGCRMRDEETGRQQARDQLSALRSSSAAASEREIQLTLTLCPASTVTLF